MAWLRAVWQYPAVQWALCEQVPEGHWDPSFSPPAQDVHVPEKGRKSHMIHHFLSSFTFTAKELSILSNKNNSVTQTLLVPSARSLLEEQALQSHAYSAPLSYIVHSLPFAYLTYSPAQT